MDFEIVSEITSIKPIAAGQGVRHRSRLRKLCDGSRWQSCRELLRYDYRMVGYESLRFMGTKYTEWQTRIEGETSILRLVMKKKEPANFLACIDNEVYPASLEVRKLYRLIPNADAEAKGLLRVIDESGEDYAFEGKRFHEITVPRAVEKALLEAHRS